MSKKRNTNDGNLMNETKKTCSGSERRLYIPDDLAQAVADATSQKNLSRKAFGSVVASEGKDTPLKTLCVQNLPEWATEDELRDLFTRSSTTALESIIKTGSNLDANQIIKHIHIVRDHSTGKCVGYAYVEFADHSTATELLTTLSDPNFFFPGSNKLLKLNWAQYSPNLTSLLSNYDFYIGNIRAGLTEKFVLYVLKSIHEAVSAVRLVPQELLGTAPPFWHPQGKEDTEGNQNTWNHWEVSCAFYQTECDGRKRKSTSKEASPRTIDPKFQGTHESQHWSCGFIRLQDAFIAQQKHVFDKLTEALKGQAGDVLRRTVLVSYQNSEEKIIQHVSTALVLRFINPNNSDLSASTKQSNGRLATQSAGLISCRETLSYPLVKQKSDGVTENQRSLFVSNLCEDEKEENLAMLFAPFGMILSLRIASLKRIAFVDFTNHTCALAALCHLRSCLYRNQRLQVCWGRSTAGLRAGYKSSDIFLTRQHSINLQEKSYASRLLQAMQPQWIKTETRPQDKASECDDIEKRKLFLASLYVSLPKANELAQ